MIMSIMLAQSYYVFMESTTGAPKKEELFRSPSIFQQ